VKNIIWPSLQNHKETLNFHLKQNPRFQLKEAYITTFKTTKMKHKCRIYNPRGPIRFTSANLNKTHTHTMFYQNSRNIQAKIKEEEEMSHRNRAEVHSPAAATTPRRWLDHRNPKSHHHRLNRPLHSCSLSLSRVHL